MATITTKETRAFNWANPGTLKVGDEIVETLKDGRDVVFVVMDDGVIGLKNLLGYHHMNEDWTNGGGWLACDMRRYLNEEVIALLPDELVAAIKPRKFDEDGDAIWWWERSPYGSDSGSFCSVNSGGYASLYGASYANGVCFGFYI